MVRGTGKSKIIDVNLVNMATVRAFQSPTDLSQWVYPSSVPGAHGNSFTFPLGIRKQCTDVRNILSQAFNARKSCSLLLMGPSGSGKSLAMRCVLESFFQDFQSSSIQQFRTITLDGTMVGRNDAMALKEICRQLCQYHSDLSMPKNSSFNEDLKFLQFSLEKYSQANIPLVLILESFDRFTCTDTLQPKFKQTLLYNLFEIIQDHNSQVAVVGLTTYLNIFEMLEKRIISRFSHRKIIFSCLEAEEVHSLLVSYLESSSIFYQSSDKKLVSSTIISQKDKLLLLLKENASSIETCVSLGKPISWFLNILRLNPRLDPSLFQKMLNHFLTDHHTSMVDTCTILELTILGSMLRLAFKENKSTNMSKAFEEYKETALKSTVDSVQRFDLAMFTQGLLSLLEKGMVQFVDARDISKLSSVSMYRFEMVELVLDLDILSDCISSSSNSPTWLQTWVTQLTLS